MRFVVVALLFLGVISAVPLGDFDDYGDDDDDQGLEYDLEERVYLDDKKPCCFPSKFEAFFGERIAYSVHRREEKEMMVSNDIDKRHHPRPHPRPRITRMGVLGRIAIDGDAKRAAMRMRIMQFPHPRNMTVVINYANKTMYIADPDKQKCKKVAFDKPMAPMCIPDNSTYRGSFRMGSGDNSLVVDSWKVRTVQRKPVRTMMGAEILVASGNCVPLTEKGGGVAGKMRVGFEASFVNLNTTISDPDVFSPPSYCDQAEVIDISEADPSVLTFTSRFHQEQ
jgi:hypothetical protein